MAKHKALNAARPTRKSKAATETDRIIGGKPARLSMELSTETHRALKIRAAAEGKTIKTYILTLLKQDGIPVPEMD